MTGSQGDVARSLLGKRHLNPEDLRPHRPGMVCSVYSTRGWLGGKSSCRRGTWILESFPWQSPPRSEQESAFLSALWKQLNRGSRILLDPKVTEYILKNVEPLKASFSNIQSKAFVLGEWDFQPAEATEKRFAEEVVKRCSAAESYLCPQFPLSSLSQLPPEEKRRGDFLMVIPDRVSLIELDGAQHDTQEGSRMDQERDSALQRDHVTTVRIKTREIDSEAKRISTFLPNAKATLEPEQFAHVVSVSLWECLMRGWVGPASSKMQIVILSPYVDGTVEAMARIAVAGAWRHLRELAALYGLAINEAMQWDVQVVLADRDHVDLPEQGDLVLGLGVLPSGVASQRFLLYRDIPIEWRITTTPPPCQGVAVIPTRKRCLYFLRMFFGHNAFQPGQYEALERILMGKDALVLLPTGSGKSVIYQLSALLLPGTCIYVSPLISLIDDQRANLEKHGMDRVAWLSGELSGQDRSMQLIEFQSGRSSYCLISPERLRMADFQAAVHSLVEHSAVSLVVVDEAHCVSEWGHSFRPAYLGLGAACRTLCASKGRIPPLLGLTGTASLAVLKDVKRDLQIMDLQAILSATSFDRKELHYHIEHCRSDKKHEKLEQILSTYLPSHFQIDKKMLYSPKGEETAAGIVFCPRARGRNGVEDIHQTVGRVVSGELVAQHYTGVTSPRPASLNKEDARKFRDNIQSVMVATKGYGMGVNKPNVRFTIHYGLPASIEEFYQEAGRAGRDHAAASCILLVSLDETDKAKQMLRRDLSFKEVKNVYDSKTFPDDDVASNMYWHFQNFEGTKQDVDEMREILATYGGDDVGSDKVIHWSDNNEQKSCLKAVNRLQLIGCVTKYEVDYGAKSISISFAPFDNLIMENRLLEYVGNYSTTRARGFREELPSYSGNPRDYVMSLAEKLVAFIYDVVEKGRRVSLDELVQACGPEATGETLRARTLAYLNPSSMDAHLLTIREDPGNEEAWGAIGDGLVGADDVLALRGASGQMLTSYYDSPGLRLVRGISEALAADGQQQVCAENILQSWSDRGKHGMTDADWCQMFLKARSAVANKGPSSTTSLIAICCQICPNHEWPCAMAQFAETDEERTAIIASIARAGFSGVSKFYEQLREISQ